MSELMKKHLTNAKFAHIKWHDNYYQIPIEILNQYQTNKSHYLADEAFDDLLKEHSKAGLHLQGLRHKENLTQTALAKIIQVSQANISAMENGRRPIGKTIAKRLQQHFGIDYRLFL